MTAYRHPDVCSGLLHYPTSSFIHWNPVALRFLSFILNSGLLQLCSDQLFPAGVGLHGSAGLQD